MALTDVIDRLTEVNEEQLLETQFIKTEIETLTDRVTSLLELNKQDRLDRLEAMREGAGISAPSMTAGGVTNDKTGGLFNLGNFGILDLLGLSALFDRVKQIFGVIGSIVVALGRVFSVGALAALEGTLKLLQGSFQLIEDLAFKLRNLPGFGKLADFLSRITLAFEDMATKVANLRKALSGPLKFLGNIAKVFGKLFWPLTALMAAWSGVKGFIEGYQEDGIIGGIQGAVEGIVNTLVFGLLQLITDATGWLLGKLGWEEGKKFFEKINFAEFFGSFYDSIFGNIRIVFDNIGDLFRGEFSWEKARETLMALLKIFTPIGGLSEWLNKALDFIKYDVLKFDPKDADQTLMGYLGDLFKSIFDTLMETVKNFGKTIKRDIDMTVTAFGFVFMNMFDELLLAIQKRVRIRLPELPNEDFKIPLGPISITVPKGFIMSGQEFGVGDPDVTQQRMQNRQIQMLDAVNQYQAAGGGLYSGYFQPIANNSGAAVQALNNMTGASGGGTTIIYQTTNNVSGGGGGGSTSSPNASSSTAAASNDYQGTLDATQFISGGPAR